MLDYATVFIEKQSAATPSEGRGHRFESCRVRQSFQSLSRSISLQVLGYNVAVAMKRLLLRCGMVTEYDLGVYYSELAENLRQLGENLRQLGENYRGGVNKTLPPTVSENPTFAKTGGSSHRQQSA